MMLRVSSDQSRGWRTLLPRVGHATLSSRLPHAHRRLDVAVRTSRPQSQLATPGRQLHGFVVRRKKDIPELQLTAIQLLHERTGAEYIHIARDDKNNVFSIGFKTNPPDSTGVPHILEHTTLCGSKKYPVRDPFFKMMRRSLANFMNAFTAPDYTTYPFATTNHQDFKNLMSVYLDATLHPLLEESDFLQEGWRIGPENPLQSSTSAIANPSNNDLVFKGVVYNEMKGQMSDAGYLYHTRFQDHIFPSIKNSGGQPERMTELTYAKLKEFHKAHYHPSNARIFTYGNMPLASHTKLLDEHLKDFEKRNAHSQPIFPTSLEKGPIHHVVDGPWDPMLEPSRQFKTSTTWLLGPSANVLETFSLGVMSSLLFGGYGSPLFQALIESGLGLDFTPNSGMDSSSRVNIFSVGVNGVRASDIPLVKNAIEMKLSEVHRRGFESAKVDGVLHQLDLTLRHQSADLGLSLMQRLQPGWFNDVDPFQILAWDETVKKFRAEMERKGYLEDLLNRYLLNDRTMTVTMEGSRAFEANVRQEEDTRLAMKIREAAGANNNEDVAAQRFISQELQLLDKQRKAPDEDISSLPTLYIKDIPRRKDVKPVRDSKIGSVQIQLREAATNDLTYFRGINRLQGLPRSLRLMMPLFTETVMRLGTKDKSVEELEDLIKLKTGGISVGYHSTTSPFDIQSSTEGICFSGYALNKNVAAMYELLRAILLETDLTNAKAKDKIHQLIQTEASGASDAIANSGHSYASTYTEACLTSHGQFSEQVQGLTQIQNNLELCSRPSSDQLEDVVTKLQAIQKLVISNSPALRTAITCGSESISSNEVLLQEFLQGLPASTDAPSGQHASELATIHPSTFFPLPYQVWYTAASVPTVPYSNPDGPALQILSELLTHKHLHHEIREKGGAYGGGSVAKSLKGTFGFYSFRDPNPENSLRIIREAGQFAVDKTWTAQDLDEAKLSTFQTVDAPQSVSDEGMTRFLSGVDEEMEQTRRERLLDVTSDDVRRVAQTYLVDGMKDMKTAVLGAKKDWANLERGWAVKNIELERLGEPQELAAAAA